MSTSGSVDLGATVNGGGGGGGGVSSLNGETGAVTIVAGSNITVTPAGQNITIASSAPWLTYPAQTSPRPLQY